MREPLDSKNGRHPCVRVGARFGLCRRWVIQNHGPESCEASTLLASFTDADTLTDRQLKPSDPGMHSIHASSSSQSSVKEWDAPGPISLVMESMKLFNSRCGTEVQSRPLSGTFSVDL